jgi:large subunit ribosomal protein L2
MTVIKAKPTSPGRRGVIYIKSDLYKGRPYKALLEKKSKNGGRNNNGRITVRHQGGGHKQHYRVIDLKETRQRSQQSWKGLSMIQTDLPI